MVKTATFYFCHTQNFAEYFFLRFTGSKSKSKFHYAYMITPFLFNSYSVSLLYGVHYILKFSYIEK